MCGWPGVGVGGRGRGGVGYGIFSFHVPALCSSPQLNVRGVRDSLLTPKGTESTNK